MTVLYITGDFNFHVDNPDKSYAKELLSLLDTFGLTQHVQEPNHSCGHTLDLVVSRGINISVSGPGPVGSPLCLFHSFHVPTN